MDITQYSEVERIFTEVIDLPASQRIAAAARLAGDDQLAEAVTALIHEHERLAESPFLADDLLTERLEWTVAEELDDSLPEDINGYTIKRILGKGASGTVYLAQSPPPLSRLVALKLIHADASASTVVRFREEQRVLASLEHPGIARVFLEGITATGRAFTVLEFIDGSIITDFCNEHQLHWRAAVELMMQACDAVAHAHQRNIIHRDLKPSNLLVTETEGGALVKVIDFGIAKLVDPLRALTALTLDTQFVGTLPYASPEQLDAGEGQDTRSDVHALGVVLYECLTHRHPFCRETDSLKSIIHAVSAKPVPPLEPMPGMPTRELDAILARACVKDPEGRYPSPGHLGEDLRRLLAGHPLVAMKPRPVYLMRKFIGRHRVGLAVAGVVLAVLVAMGGVAIDKGLDAAHSRDTVRAIAIGLVDDVLPRLADLPGSSAVRKDLAASLHERVDELLAADPSDQALLLRKARILEYESDMVLADELVDESEVLRTQAAALIAGLHAERPEDAQLRADERRLTIKLGDIAKSRKDWIVARSFYERAHDLLAAEPGDHREGLSWSLERLAFVASRQGLRDDALRLANERLQLALTLNAEQPGTPDLVRSCGVAHQFLSDLNTSRSDFESAYDHAVQAVSFADELMRLDPEKFTSGHLEISATAGLMSASYFSGRIAEADAAAERVQDLGRRFVENNPDRSDARLIVWIVLKNIRYRWVELGRFEAAETIASKMNTLRPDAPIPDLSRLINGIKGP
jgi:tetratricopeptide (TPR) repeat protein